MQPRFRMYLGQFCLHIGFISFLAVFPFYPLMEEFGNFLYLFRRRPGLDKEKMSWRNDSIKTEFSRVKSLYC